MDRVQTPGSKGVEVVAVRHHGIGEEGENGVHGRIQDAVATEGSRQGNSDCGTPRNLCSEVLQHIQSLGARILGRDQYGRVIDEVAGEVIELEAPRNHLTNGQGIPQGGSNGDIVVLDVEAQNQRDYQHESVAL